MRTACSPDYYSRAYRFSSQTLKKELRCIEIQIRVCAPECSPHTVFVTYLLTCKFTNAYLFLRIHTQHTHTHCHLLCSVLSSLSAQILCISPRVHLTNANSNVFSGLNFSQTLSPRGILLRIKFSVPRRAHTYTHIYSPCIQLCHTTNVVP